MLKYILGLDLLLPFLDFLVAWREISIDNF